MNKMQTITAVDHYAAIKRNDILILENSMLNKISQRQTDKYCLIPFYQVQKRWKIKQRLSGNGKLLFSGYRIWGLMNDGDGCTTL